jgi:hypothetical protein
MSVYFLAVSGCGGRSFDSESRATDTKLDAGAEEATDDDSAETTPDAGSSGIGEPGPGAGDDALDEMNATDATGVDDSADESNVDDFSAKDEDTGDETATQKTESTEPAGGDAPPNDDMSVAGDDEPPSDGQEMPADEPGGDASDDTDPEGVAGDPPQGDDQSDADEPTVVLPKVDCAASFEYASSPEAVADALAALIWGAGPDSELTRAAEAGELANSADAQVQAARMIQTPEAREYLGDFGPWWVSNARKVPLTLTKDPEAFPEFDTQLGNDMLDSLRAFSQSTIVEGGTLGDFLTSSVDYVNDNLAPLHGLAPNFGPELTRVEVDPAKRAGFFTHPYFLSLWGSVDTRPTQRGLFLMQRLLCTNLATPPAGIDNTPIPRIDGTTNRETIEAQTADPACAACHQLITLPGFAFESYDALGRYRTEDQGLPIDTTTSVQVDGVAHDYENAIEMLTDLASMESVKQCMSNQWLGFLLQRAPSLALQPRSYAIESDAVCDPTNEACIDQVGDFVAGLSGCARTDDGDLDLLQLTAVIATHPLLVDGSFQCGQERCLTDFEYCLQEDGVPARCLPGPSPDCASDAPGLDGCSCQTGAYGGSVVVCE